MTAEIKIDLNPTQVFVGTTHEGAQVKRYADMAEVLSMLSGSAMIETGLLPPNTRFCRLHQRGATLAVEVPAGKHRISIKHDRSFMNMTPMTVEDVPLPAAIFVLQATHDGRQGPYKLTSSVVYALKHGLATEQDELFLYPAPNILGGQEICWGWDTYAANTANYRSLAGFEGAISLFFRAGFNDHCFEKRRLSDKFDWSKIPDYRAVEKYFDWLRVCGRFDPDWLVPANTTFAKLIK